MMKPLMYLLLASFIPPTWATTPTRRPGGEAPPTRRPGGEGRREESGRRGKTLLTSTHAPTAKVLDFSLNDNSPDSYGSFTGATLEKEDLPPSVTICVAYMMEAHSGKI